MPQPLNVQP